MPPVTVPVVEVPVIVNPPAHPDYATRPAGGVSGSGPVGGSQSGQPGKSGASGGTTTTSGGTTTTKQPTGEPAPPLHRPEPLHPPQSLPHPVNGPPAIPKTGPSTDTPKKLIASSLAEENYHREVLKDINPAAPDFRKALADLDAWTKDFPASPSQTDRAYYYIHVYNSTGRPDRVLEAAAPLVAAGVRANFADGQQVLQVLVAASGSVAKLPAPTAQQLATGQKAAKELLEFLPDYFAPRRKPAKVSDAEWALTRVQLENVARDALARQAKRAAAN